jgi:hypothetical protein
MTYEIAKELNDAGFPYHYPLVCGCDLGIRCTNHAVTDFVYTPKLSELIDACPKQNPTDKTEYLSLRYHRDGHWLAGYSGFEKWGIAEMGLTPDEAMARLWLRLNTKPNASAFS